MFSLKAKIMPQSKMLFSILFMSVLCCSTELFADGKQKKEGNKITYNGNVFEMEGQPNDTFYVENLETYEREMRIAKSDTIPIKMNMEKVFEEEKVNQKVGQADAADELLTQFFKNNRIAFSALEAGGYELILKGVVIGKDGKIKLYQPQILSHSYDLENPLRNSTWVSKPVTPLEILTKIENLFESFLLGLQFEPAKLNGQKVVCLTKYFGYQNKLKIIVENHYARLESEPQVFELQISK